MVKRAERRLPLPAVFLGVSLFASAVAGEAVVHLSTTKRLVEVIGLLVCAVVGANFAFRRRVLLAVIAFLAPFDFSVHVFGLATYITEVVTVVLTPIIAARGFSFRGTPWWARAGASLLVGGSLLAALGAADPGTAAVGTLRWTMAIVLMFSAMQEFAERGHASDRLAAIILSTGAILALGAVEQRAGVYTLVGKPFLPGRLDSFVGYYSAYAGILAASICVGLGWVVLRLQRRERWTLSTAAVGCCFIGLLLSLSRGALAAAAGGIGVLVMVQLRRPRSALKVVGTLALAIAVAAVVVPPATITRYELRFTSVNSANGDAVRYQLQDVGAAALATHPLGLGYGNFKHYASTQGLLEVLAHAHETYIQIGLDAGWLGLAGFVLLMLGAAGRGLLSASPVANGFGAAIVTVLIQGIEDYQYFEVPYFLLTAMLIFGAWHAARVSRCQVGPHGYLETAQDELQPAGLWGG